MSKPFIYTSCNNCNHRGTSHEPKKLWFGVTSLTNCMVKGCGCAKYRIPTEATIADRKARQKHGF